MTETNFPAPPADNTRRFADRAATYVKYRPSYPAGVRETLRDAAGLTPDSVIADIGSGTGILAKIFLENSNGVFGVEPNREMREAGEQFLSLYPRFVSVAGTAEATTLPDACADFVTAGQAFHWFAPDAARTEFQRILRPGGQVALVWNGRPTAGTPFLEGYTALLRTHSPDYAQVNHRDRVGEAVIERFFGANGYTLRTFPNVQHFDDDGLRGRTLSSSYVPQEGQPGHEEMMQGLRDLFDATQENGTVAFLYETELYFGKIG